MHLPLRERASGLEQGEFVTEGTWFLALALSRIVHMEGRERIPGQGCTVKALGSDTFALEPFVDAELRRKGYQEPSPDAAYPSGYRVVELVLWNSCQLTQSPRQHSRDDDATATKLQSDQQLLGIQVGLAGLVLA